MADLGSLLIEFSAEDRTLLVDLLRALEAHAQPAPEALDVERLAKAIRESGVAVPALSVDAVAAIIAREYAALGEEPTRG